MSEKIELTPMEEAVRHTAEKIEAEEVAEIEAERHTAEHPEDHIKGSYQAELEECCGGHCGCHEQKEPDWTPGAPELAANVEKVLPTFRDTKGRKVGRNSLCPCGSSKKFKHCCIDIVN